jgi:hypothetical protein
MPSGADEMQVHRCMKLQVSVRGPIFERYTFGDPVRPVECQWSPEVVLRASFIVVSWSVLAL